MNSALPKHVMEVIGRIAWLDDHPKGISHWIEALNDERIHVNQFSEQTKFLANLSTHQYDLIILDERLRNNTFGSALVSQIHKKNQKAALLIFSAYSLPDDFYLKAAQIVQEHPQLRLFTLSKGEIPLVTDENFRRLFIQPIVDLIQRIPPSNPALKTVLEEAPESKFNISFDDFCSLTEEERFALSSAFRREKAAIIDRYFENGAVWLCFFGDTDEPDKTIGQIEKIPRHAIIDKEAASKGIAPFCFGRSLRVETIPAALVEGNPGECSETSGVQGYAVMTFGLGGPKIAAHFDGGSQEVFLNSRMLVDAKLIVETVSSTAYTTYTKAEFHAQIEPIRFYVDLEDGSTDSFVHLSFAVRDWVAGFLRAPCDRDCRKGPQEICRFRNPGLIGRALLRSGGLNYRVNDDYMLELARRGAPPSDIR